MSKNMEYISDTQTLIGQQKRTLIDQETGEVVHVDQITKRVYGTKQFWKVYLMDFLSILGIIDSKQLDVFIYIAENTNQNTNMFIGTYRSISEDVGVGVSTVTRIMKKLQENNFIMKKQNGVYLVNPNIMMKGNDHKRQMLLSYYEEDKPLNSIEVLRGRQKAIPEQSASLENQDFLEMKKMIEGIELTIYLNDENISFDLTATQTEVIFKALELNLIKNNTMTTFSDSSLKKHILPKINFVPINK